MTSLRSDVARELLELPSGQPQRTALHDRFDCTIVTPSTIVIANNDGWRVEVRERPVLVTKEVRAAIERHAVESRPAECCGLLSGADGVITDLHPLRNDADRPETRYSAAPEDLFAATRRIRDTGHSLLGIYHSHPRSVAYPSPSDVEMAFYPEAAYFIISLEPMVELRAFRIRDAGIEDLPIALVGNGARN